jgi:hypothetical protein
MRELLSDATGGAAADLVRTYLDVERPARADRPWVVADFVVSPDGSVATGGRVGGLSSRSDQQVFHLLRAAGDVVLVGAGTVRAEGYGPHRPTEQDRAWRSARGLPPAAAVAVVTAQQSGGADRLAQLVVDARDLVAAQSRRGGQPGDGQPDGDDSEQRCGTQGRQAIRL